MRRKLNESFASRVSINLVELVRDYPELNGQLDKIAKELNETLPECEISKEEMNGSVYMIIDNVDPESIMDIFMDDYYIDDIAQYIEADDKEADEWDEEYPEYDEVDTEDELEECGSGDCFEDEDFLDEDEELLDNEEELLDNEDEFIEEDDEFECYEAAKANMHRNRRLNEKKKGCCPPKKGRMVNLSTALNQSRHISSIVESARRTSLNESIINKAMIKARKSGKNNKLFEKRRTLMEIKKQIGSAKFNTIVKALRERRSTLYTNKVINGKNMRKYSAKELLELLNTVKAQHTTLVASYKSLNESVTRSTRNELIKEIELKERLMNLIDEELTYRLILKKLIKESDENPLEPLSTDPTEGNEEESSEGNDEETTEETEEESTEETDEEVELSRVVITLASEEAANELKDTLVDAGIPEDALEIEEDSEDDEEDTSEESETESEEETEETEETSESVHYNKFKKLLEDEETEESEGSEETEEETEEESDEESEGAVKLILTDTDHINTLADVLNNEYGITKEEFEEMIGGEIVDETEESEETEEETEEPSDKSSSGDDAVDALSQEELDKLFGEK